MDIRKVKKLIELLEESGIAEIEISEGEESVRISRYPTRPARCSAVRALRGSAPAAPMRGAAPPMLPPSRRRANARRRKLITP